MRNVLGVAPRLCDLVKAVVGAANGGESHHLESMDESR